MANPLFGTTTMHVAALFVAWGEAQAKAFLEAVKANGTKMASSNGEVKRLVVSGEAAFGLTDTDDANEAIKEEAKVEAIYPDQDGIGTLVMPTAIVMIKGGPHPDEAAKLVDWLAGAEVEKALAESAAHMPLRPEVVVPAGMRPLKEIRAMSVDYAKVADQMDAIQPWLRSWAGM
jgi:iron(III) transport system substrate-binding protein